MFLISFYFNRAIYGLEVRVDDETATKLLYAAHKYECVDVIEMVEEHLIDAVTPENVLSIYEHAHLHQCFNLEVKCFDVSSFLVLMQKNRR